MAREQSLKSTKMDNDLPPFPYDVSADKKRFDVMLMINDLPKTEWFERVNLHTDTFRGVPKRTCDRIYKMCFTDPHKSPYEVLEKLTQKFDGVLVPFLVGLCSIREDYTYPYDGPNWCSFMDWKFQDRLRRFIWGNIASNPVMLGKPRKKLLKQYRTWVLSGMNPDNEPKSIRGLEIISDSIKAILSFNLPPRERIQRIVSFCYGRTSDVPEKSVRMAELQDVIDQRKRSVTFNEHHFAEKQVNRWIARFESMPLFKHLEKLSRVSKVKSSNKGSRDYGRSKNGKNGYIQIVIRDLMTQYKTLPQENRANIEQFGDTMRVANLDTGEVEEVQTSTLSFGEKVFQKLFMELWDLLAEENPKLRDPSQFYYAIEESIQNTGVVYDCLGAKVLDLPELGSKVRIPTERDARVSLVLLSIMNPMWECLEGISIFNDMSDGNAAWKAPNRRDFSDVSGNFPNSVFFSDLTKSTDGPFKVIFDRLLRWLGDKIGMPSFAF